IIPASCAARQRRSPAISSKRSPSWRTTTGCTMPFSRIDSTSPSRPVKSVRGWYLLGWVPSTARISRAASGPATGLLRVRRLSPFPSACFFMMADHLARQVHVRLRSLRADVVEHDGTAERGGFPQPDVSGDDGAVHLFLEVLAQVVDDLARQVGPFVEHGE